MISKGIYSAKGVDAEVRCSSNFYNQSANEEIIKFAVEFQKQLQRKKMTEEEQRKHEEEIKRAEAEKRKIIQDEYLSKLDRAHKELKKYEKMLKKNRLKYLDKIPPLESDWPDYRYQDDFCKIISKCENGDCLNIL